MTELKRWVKLSDLPDPRLFSKVYIEYLRLSTEVASISKTIGATSRPNPPEVWGITDPKQIRLWKRWSQILQNSAKLDTGTEAPSEPGPGIDPTPSDLELDAMATPHTDSASADTYTTRAMLRKFHAGDSSASPELENLRRAFSHPLQDGVYNPPRRDATGRIDPVLTGSKAPQPHSVADILRMNAGVDPVVLGSNTTGEDLQYLEDLGMTTFCFLVQFWILPMIIFLYYDDLTVLLIYYGLSLDIIFLVIYINRFLYRDADVNPPR